MTTPPLPAVLQNPDPAPLYQAVYDALADAYWDASDMASKDLIHGTQETIGKIITAYDEQGLATNTDAYLKLAPKIKAVHEQLEQIETQIKQITKNIQTSVSVLSAINKLLSVLPK